MPWFLLALIGGAGALYYAKNEGSPAFDRFRVQLLDSSVATRDALSAIVMPLGGMITSELGNGAYIVSMPHNASFGALPPTLAAPGVTRVSGLSQTLLAQDDRFLGLDPDDERFRKIEGIKIAGMTWNGEHLVGAQLKAKLQLRSPKPKAKPKPKPKPKAHPASFTASLMNKIHAKAKPSRPLVRTSVPALASVLSKRASAPIKSAQPKPRSLRVPTKKPADPKTPPSEFDLAANAAHPGAPNAAPPGGGGGGGPSDGGGGGGGGGGDSDDGGGYDDADDSGSDDSSDSDDSSADDSGSDDSSADDSGSDSDSDDSSTDASNSDDSSDSDDSDSDDDGPQTPVAGMLWNGRELR